MNRHILNESQKEALLRRMERIYRQFKKDFDWQDEKHYREGIIDFCDAIIFVSSEHTYEISSLRSDIEELFDEIDYEMEDEDETE